eukprot:jgi/Mesen1/5564/ME000280S04686
MMDSSTYYSMLLLPALALLALIPSAAAGESVYLVRLNTPPLLKQTGGEIGIHSRAAAAFRSRAIAAHSSLLRRTTGRSNSKVYSYTDVCNGFAARLTAGEAAALRASPEVFSVEKDAVHRPATSFTPSYLKLDSKSPPGAWSKSTGKGAILAVVDTGIWPEHEQFNDANMDPPPASFKGICQLGSGWNKTHCSKKIIGARYFPDGFEAHYNVSLGDGKLDEIRSARDALGHGTFTSAVAAGNVVTNVVSDGAALGTVRGVAPDAHISVYKVCWTEGGVAPIDASLTCLSSDILAALDKVVADGATAIVVALVGPPSFVDTVSQGGFTAAGLNVPLVTPAGNDGVDISYKSHSTVANNAPWYITVAASTVPREFVNSVKLGNSASYQASRILLPRVQVTVAAEKLAKSFGCRFRAYGLAWEGSELSPQQRARALLRHARVRFFRHVSHRARLAVSASSSPAAAAGGAPSPSSLLPARAAGEQGATLTGGTLPAKKLLPIVYGATAADPNFEAATAQLCTRGSLDPKKVKGKIVFCDRGINLRVAKSVEVKRAGGAGMILANIAGGGELTTPEIHAVPTVQLGAAAGALVRAYFKTRSPTAYITGVAQKLNGVRAPQMAGVSSVGPNTIIPHILKPPSPPSPRRFRCKTPQSDRLSGESEALADPEGHAPLQLHAVDGGDGAHPDPVGARNRVQGLASPHSVNGPLLGQGDGGRQQRGGWGRGQGARVGCRGRSHRALTRLLEPPELTRLLACHLQTHPDVTAPGFQVIAAWSPSGSPTKLPGDDRKFHYNIQYGTSVSAAHVAGAALLLKAVHPDWTLGIIQSALVTTGTHSLFGLGFRNFGFGRRLRLVGPPATYRATVVAPAGVRVQVVPATLKFTRQGKDGERAFQVIFFATSVTVDSYRANYTFGSLTWTDGTHTIVSPIAVNVVA